MNKKLRSLLSVTLCAVLICCGAGGALTALAAEGEDPEETPALTAAATAVDQEPANDTVYVLSGADGSVEKVIGGTDADVPVDVRVSYTLDGKPISPETLAGKSGRVTIRFDYDNRQVETVEVDGRQEQVTVPLVMISGLLLDNDKFSNVSVTPGKLLSDGSRTVVVGLAVPGLQDDLRLDSEKLDAGKLDLKDSVEITADVTDFSLDMTLTVAASDVFSDLDPLENLGDLDALQDSLDRLTDAMTQLLDGSGQLADGLETLLEKSGELSSGVDRLAAGSASLRSGAAQLDQGVTSLQSGAAQLSAGLNTLSSNSAQLNDGAAQVFNTLLATANSQIAAAGLEVPTLTIGNYADVLNNVIASLDDTVYTKALEQVTAAVEAQRPVIREKVAQAVEAEVTTQVTAAVRSQVEGQVADAVWQAALPQVTEQVAAAVRAQVRAQVLQAAAGLTPEAYDAAVAAGQVDEATQAAVEAALTQQLASEEVQSLLAQQIEAQRSSDAVTDAVAAQLEAQMASQQVQAVIASTVQEKLASQEVQSLIDQNTETQVQLIISQQMAGDEVQAKMAAAKEQAKPLIGLKASLDSYNAFYLGLQSYTAGVDQLAAGAGALKAGTDQLKSGSTQLTAGAGQLDDGLAKLQSSTPALVEGVTQLRDGAKALNDGLTRFDEEGVQQLVDAVEGDGAALLSRLKAIQQAADDYAARTGGSRKVIYRTGSIGA